MRCVSLARGEESGGFLAFSETKRTHFFVAGWMWRVEQNVRMSRNALMFRAFAKRSQIRARAGDGWTGPFSREFVGGRSVAETNKQIDDLREASMQTIRDLMPLAPRGP
jgi:hypothetical protein